MLLIKTPINAPTKQIISYMCSTSWSTKYATTETINGLILIKIAPLLIGKYLSAMKKQGIPIPPVNTLKIMDK